MVREAQQTATMVTPGTSPSVQTLLHVHRTAKSKGSSPMTGLVHMEWSKWMGESKWLWLLMELIVLILAQELTW